MILLLIGFRLTILASASATGAHEDMINLLFRDNHLSVLKRDSFGRSPMQLFKQSSLKNKEGSETCSSPHQDDKIPSGLPKTTSKRLSSDETTSD